MNNAELHDLIPLHALGALEPSEVPFLEAYLALNPEAQASYVWYLEAVTVLARALPLEEPPQDLKARMLARVRQGDGRQNAGLQVAPVPDLAAFSRTPAVPIIPSQTRPRASRIPRRRMRFVPVALGGMALAVMAGLVMQNLQLGNNLRLLEASEQNLKRLLASSATQSAVLNTSDGKVPIGNVFVGNEGQLFISHLMPALPNGKTWQAWYILKGESTPRSLGTTNDAHLMTQLPAGAQVIAVSEEPTGGSRTPTLIRAIANL